MTKPRPGLAHDPLAAPPRIPPVIPKTVIDEDTTISSTTSAAPTPTPPDATPAAQTTSPEQTTPAKRSTKATTTTAPGPDERPPGSHARRGPASMEPGAPKKSYSFYVDNLLLEEARDAVIHLASDPDGPRNLSALIEEGLRRELIRLQDDLNTGDPFPHRRVALRRGGNTRNM